MRRGRCARARRASAAWGSVQRHRTRRLRSWAARHPCWCRRGCLLCSRCGVPRRNKLSLDPGLCTLDGVLLVPAVLFVMQQVWLWYECMRGLSDPAARATIVGRVVICSTHGSDTGSSSETLNGLLLVLSFSPALLYHFAAVCVCMR